MLETLLSGDPRAQWVRGKRNRYGVKGALFPSGVFSIRSIPALGALHTTWSLPYRGLKDADHRDE
ncbi:hypothetical protein JYU34_003567 [Plutella xylostella]|uniref:Uncharacterized protein n=1 Tax=Plutella xylostella TaxID=51655 RepID=A0ABQ7R0D9_PLUXY|nr:hypothetical protein JYU34_003567 [Plutella xylostella]